MTATVRNAVIKRAALAAIGKRKPDMAMKTIKRIRKDSLGFRLVYMTTFAVFLAVAIADRLVPLRWLTGSAGSQSYLGILSEAQSAADTYTPFAFMG